MIAPVKCSVLPLSRSQEFTPFIRQICTYGALRFLPCIEFPYNPVLFYWHMYDVQRYEILLRQEIFEACLKNFQDSLSLSQQF